MTKHQLLRISIIAVFAVLNLEHSVFGVGVSPINAGCYISAPGDCRIHVDPFTVNVSFKSRLEAFKLVVGRRNIYQFATDSSNPPAGNYAPSSPQFDFAATCGQGHNLVLFAKDSGDLTYQNVGASSSITCPDGAGWLVWIPEATTREATSLAQGSAVLQGIVNAQGGSTEVTFQYGKTTEYGNEITATPTDLEDANDHHVSATISGLELNTTYHFRVIAQNSAGTTFGGDRTLQVSGVVLAPVYFLLQNEP